VELGGSLSSPSTTSKTSAEDLRVPSDDLQVPPGSEPLEWRLTLALCRPMVTVSSII